MKGMKNQILLSVFSIMFYLCMPSVLSQTPIDTLLSINLDTIRIDGEDIPDTLFQSQPDYLWMGPHELQATFPPTEQKFVKDTSRHYVTAWIIFAIFILSLIKFMFPHRFRENLMASWELRYFNQIEREGGLFNNWVSFFLYINFLFTISLLIYQTLIHASFQNILPVEHPLAILLYGIALPSVFYFSKYILMLFTGWVFNTMRPTETSFRTTLIINQFTGIALLPLLVINFYNPAAWLLYLAWMILGVLALYKLVRISLIGLRMTPFSTYHLILYLCTVEIAPILFIYKYSETFILS